MSGHSTHSASSNIMKSFKILPFVALAAATLAYAADTPASSPDQSDSNKTIHLQTSTAATLTPDQELSGAYTGVLDKDHPTATWRVVAETGGIYGVAIQYSSLSVLTPVVLEIGGQQYDLTLRPTRRTHLSPEFRVEVPSGAPVVIRLSLREGVTGPVPVQMISIRFDPPENRARPDLFINVPDPTLVSPSS
ncbi:hypothetical protein OPIT5_17940 [Opitutaceae bacterium TAV5]|nr:hypothetical protein OPIT5_17940 [Opitutaceae bacterium TAV5]